MTAECRRRDITEAAVQLFERRGLGASTREIADAAGIAEGTLFRVFATKHDLIHHVFTELLDPTWLIGELAAIDRQAPVPDRVDAVVNHLLTAAQRLHKLMSVFHSTTVRPRFGRLRGLPDEASHEDFQAIAERRSEAIIQAIVEVFDTDDLDVDPVVAAAFIRAVTWSGVIPPIAHPALRDPELLRHLIRRALGLDPQPKDSR
jgi:AcrR family transcriptional regulator